MMRRISDETIEEINRLRDAGHPVRAVSKALGVSPWTVLKYSKRRDAENYSTPEQWEAWKTLRRSGVPAKDIAKMYGCSLTTIYHHTQEQRKRPEIFIDIDSSDAVTPAQIKSVKEKLYVGMPVLLFRSADDKAGTRIRGKVTGLYKYVFTASAGKFSEAFQYSDLLTYDGRRQVREA